MTTQSAFAQALLHPDAPVPPGITGPDGRPDARRFAVYRNNVAASLTRALEAAFPVVRKLVGEDFFAAMALVFLRAHPPTSRQLMLYGAEFPCFLAGFPPVAHLGYLPDVARLEQALRESHHAADSRPVPAERLAALPESRLLTARLGLAPSLRLMRSDWPVFGIWAANALGHPAPRPGAEEVVVLRPEFDARPHLLPPGGFAFLTALQAGQPLMAALAAAPAGFDLTAVLGLLLQGNAIVEVTE